MLDLVFTLLLFLNFQQADTVVTIQGKVLDSSTTMPVANARVVFLRLGPGASLGPDLLDTPVAAGEPDVEAARLAVIAGTDGAFRFRVRGPVTFALFVNADGYVKTPRAFAPENRYEAKPGEKGSEIVLLAAPAMSISGRVIDFDTGAPVPALEVRPTRYRNTGVSRVLVSTESGKTGEDGRFSVQGLSPGEYYLSFAPSYRPGIKPPEPIEDFRSAVEEHYAVTWYPGVEREQDCLPIILTGGSNIEGLEVKLAKRRVAAIRGRVLGEGTLQQADLMLFSVDRRVDSAGFALTAGGKLQVGSEFEIKRLSPGVYTLSAIIAGEAPEDRKVAIRVLHLLAENLDGLDLSPQAGVTVNGRVQLAGREIKEDEPELPVDDLRIALSPTVRMGLGNENLTAIAESKGGTFAIKGVFADTYRLSVQRSPKGYRLSEVRYNGAVCTHGIVALDPGAREHRVEVKLAPASASVTITATDGSNESPGAAILLLPEPVNADILHSRALWGQAKAGKDGRGTIGNLLPGVYRAVAYREGSFWADDPDLRSRIAAGQEVRLTEGQHAAVQVRVLRFP